jgi:uroporphyrinogen III methyltransferase/synthase
LLAEFAGTVVFYMGIENLDDITHKLIENGRSPDTPAAVVADATMPAQRTAKATLATLAACCAKNKITPPALIFIGPTSVGDSRLEWLTKLPLFGKTVVVTRDAQGGEELAAKFAARMAVTMEIPVTKIKTLTDSGDFVKTLAQIKFYDWIIFTSCNGVETFFAALAKLKKDARVFGSAKIAAIGARTAETLARFGIKADFVPSAFTSKDLAAGLIDFTNLRDKKILLLRSQIASDDLSQLLEAAGASADNVPVYTHEKNLCDLKPLSEKSIHWLTFASPFAAKCFFEQVSVDFVKSKDAKVASIGPVTSKKLAELGMKVDIEASEHTFDGLISAIEQYELRTTK